MRLRLVEVQIRVDQQDAGEAPLPKDLPSLVAEMFPGLEQWDRDWPAVSDARARIVRVSPRASKCP